MSNLDEVRLAQLRHLMNTHPDPRLRHRAHGVLLVSEGHAVSEVARWFHTAAHCVRSWRDRFLAEGEAGLQDRSRQGRPPKLDEEARQFLADTLDRPPADFGLPMTTWSIRELQGLLERERGIQVSVSTLHRTLHVMGFR